MAKLPGETVELADRLHSAAIHALRAVRGEDRASGVGPAQLSALSVLVFGGSTSLGKLAGVDQVKPPTMVRIVQSLEQQGLVRSRKDKSDQRKLVIAATVRGRSLLLRARSRRVERLARALEQVSEEERVQLCRALDVFAEVQARLRKLE
jgi:DNA-binding MarR family transcriptional regulator